MEKSDNVKFWIYTIFKFLLLYIGPATVVVCKYVELEKATYKLSFFGLILVIVLIITGVKVFEKKYRQKYDTLLQQLAEATTVEDKNAISAEIEKHKRINDINQKIIILLPFLILYIVTYVQEKQIANLNATIGVILLLLGAGSVFDILQRPIKEKVKLAKITKK